MMTVEQIVEVAVETSKVNGTFDKSFVNELIDALRVARNEATIQKKEKEKVEKEKFAKENEEKARLYVMGLEEGDEIRWMANGVENVGKYIKHSDKTVRCELNELPENATSDNLFRNVKFEKIIVPTDSAKEEVA